MQTTISIMVVAAILSGGGGVLSSPAAALPQSVVVSARHADEPEWLESILLLQYSRKISRSEANRLETELRNNEESVTIRLRLIGYYTDKGRGSFDRLRLRTHVLWIIQRHPEHPATAEPALRDLPDDPEGNIQIHDLWSTLLQQRSNDDRVLRNAEKYFFSKDPAEAERLIRRLHQDDPDNREWPRELGELYLLSGVPSYAKTESEEIAKEAYRRVLDLTNDDRSRETLAGNMADAYFKAGNLLASAELAKIFLQSPDRRAVQRANTVLGRIAIRTGDLAAATQYLRASAKCPAMRSVPLSAPMMALAKELLEKGQRDSVIGYLVDCAAIWPEREDLFRFWISAIQNGGIPDFGNNLQ